MRRRSDSDRRKRREVCKIYYIIEIRMGGRMKIMTRGLIAERSEVNIIVFMEDK